ncbi:3-oxoacyl-ACP synthase III family protein [Carboxylicivirga taeanensis]|uniref:3-oxoacyl-ACP synthase III family protein n=1 Tax=Carboxylicivirga taeanensis TaxID=1416875 RepID=UPI003F6DAB6F
MKIQTEIIGTGIYAPGKPISNQELIEMSGVQFDVEKFESKLGIKSRHIAKYQGLKESTADFAIRAAQAAINNAGLTNADIDLIIIGTDTPEYISPATSVVVQGRLQKGQTLSYCYDVSAGCASFGMAYDNAVRIMATDHSIRHAVVVGVYNMPAFIHDNSKYTLPVFSDGAGALVIKNQGNGEHLASQMLTDGTQFDFIGIYKGGAKHQPTAQNIETKEYGLESLKPLPGDRNVELWPTLTRKLLEKADLDIDKVDHFLFTQINADVIKQVMEILGQSIEKTTMIMDRYAYTGSACIPMAMHHAIQDGRIKKGHKVLMMASGAGLAVSSNLLVY